MAQAIKNWEAASPLIDGVATPNGSAEEAVHIKLYCQMPPITKLDGSINTLKNCERLALSTNSIDKIIPLSGLPKLKILSLGRNLIKKISDLEGVAGRDIFWGEISMCFISNHIFYLIRDFGGALAFLQPS